MNRKERRAQKARGGDTAVTLKEAGPLREKLLRDRMSSVLELYSKTTPEDGPLVCVIADTDSDVIAHQIAEGTFGETGGVRVFITKPESFARLHAVLADGIGDAIANCKAGALNVLVIAHQGAAAATIFRDDDTGEFQVRKMGATEP